jgi:hypothetical protein
MLEGGDRARDIGKGGLEMGEDLRGRLACWILRQVGRQLGRWAALIQSRADLALSQVKPFPDALPGPFAPPAIGAAGSEYAAGDGALEEPPQSHGGQAEPPDLVGGPDAEGPSATATSMAVAAKDPPGAHGFFPTAALVETVQKAMPDQRANALAARARHQLEPFRKRRPYLVAVAKPALLAHESRLPENRNSTGMGEWRGTGGVRFASWSGSGVKIRERKFAKFSR